MQKLKIIFLIFLWVSCADAYSTVQKKVSGKAAQDLVQAIKMAGVIPQESANHIDYSTRKIICHTADAYTDGLIAYDCKLDNYKPIKGAPAKILYEAMLQLKLPVDAGMSQTRVAAEHVFCRVELKQSPVKYHCQLERHSAHLSYN